MIRIIALILVIIPHLLISQDRTARYDQPVELGHVSWLRDYEAAKEMAQNQDKPILILFQEVPGCATCRNYGQNVLTHPLMVEAIENEFVPLTIFNNKDGDDAKVLRIYNEPTWNNPVVRIVDAKGLDIIDRLSGNYTSLGMFTAMKEALIRSQKEVPAYMQILRDDLVLESGQVDIATYGMFCFWTGEKELGQVEGVIATSPGFTSDGEVVKVQYNPAVISKKELDKIAESGSCKKVKDGSFRMDRDPQYYLKKSKLSHLPLSISQRTKINSYLGQNKSPLDLLSPAQIHWLNSGARGKKLLYEKDFLEAWKFMRERA